MADIHAFPDRQSLVGRPRRATNEIDLSHEAIRRGVQYLAFRLEGEDLDASYAPGPGHVNSLVARAAQAAVEAHGDLMLAGVAPVSPRRIAAATARLNFARQLAEVKTRATRAPTTALRSIYLDALADFMIGELGQNRRGLSPAVKSTT